MSNLIAITIKVYYDRKLENEADIVAEIETWPGVEEVQVLGSARID